MKLGSKPRMKMKTRKAAVEKMTAWKEGWDSMKARDDREGPGKPGAVGTAA